MSPDFFVFAFGVLGACAVVSLVEGILPRVQRNRHERFIREVCRINAIVDVVAEEARKSGFVMETPGRRHTARYRWFKNHARMYSMQCLACGKKRTFVHSLRWWPVRKGDDFPTLDGSVSND